MTLNIFQVCRSK